MRTCSHTHMHAVTFKGVIAEDGDISVYKIVTDMKRKLFLLCKVVKISISLYLVVVLLGLQEVNDSRKAAKLCCENI